MNTAEKFIFALVVQLNDHLLLLISGRMFKHLLCSLIDLHEPGSPRYLPPR